MAYSAEDSALGLSKANIPVKLTNLVSGQENTANTNNEGIAVFASITPGNYTVSAAKNYTAEEFYNTTNVTIGNNAAYNATETQAINANTNIRLLLQTGKIGDLVFKQIYYAGSHKTEGANLRDQFVEIYNNSNQIIYMDSLYIGTTQSSNTKVSAGGTPYDWTKAVERMPSGIGDANKDYLYFQQLFMIPGNGKEHPLAPGKSFIIAQTALDHTKPYTGNDGKVIGESVDANLTINLSNADFETNFIEYLNASKPFGWDIDNPNVPNVKILIGAGKDWAMDTKGRDDFIIFKAPGKNIAEMPKYNMPGAGKPGLQVPISVDILDAVELITVLETDRIPKRLPIGLDAAGTFVTGGEYSFQSLIRKTVKTVEGRRILQDTNNSANDFETKTKADPSKTDASFVK
ncbi:DUF4876 domain-containing protein [Niabella aquatica]